MNINFFPVLHRSHHLVYHISEINDSDILHFFSNFDSTPSNEIKKLFIERLFAKIFDQIEQTTEPEVSF